MSDSPIHLVSGLPRDNMASEEDTSPPSSISSQSNQQQQLREDSGEGSTSARRPPRKRRRIIISCTECHRRKQKCDRNLPCSNCVSRHKQDSCRYETGAPTAKAAQQQARGDERLDSGSNGVGLTEAGIPAEMTNFGYSETGASTLGFLRKLDGSHPEESLSRMAMGREMNGEYFGTRERYKSLIRQLPARSYTEKLVDIYFKDFNWQYNVSPAMRTRQWSEL